MTIAAPGVARLIVSVGDLDRSLAFYGDRIGLVRGERTGELAWMRTGEGIEVLLHQRPAVASDTAVAISFAVDDTDRVVAEWADAGGAVVDAPADQPWGERTAVVRDPDGHLVCLVTR